MTDAADPRWGQGGIPDLNFVFEGHIRRNFRG